MTDAFEALIRNYYLSTHEGDAARLLAAFDADARIQGWFGERWIASGLEDFISAMTASTSPASRREAAIWRLEALRVDGGAAAAVVRDELGGRVFADHLHLVRGAHGWRIVAKTFTTQDPADAA